MIKIERIFLCDHIEEGQFGKLNITGLNPTNILSLSKIPYDLISYLVLNGTTSGVFKNLSLKIKCKNDLGTTVDEISNELPESNQPLENEGALFLINPVKITINQFGSMEISIVQGGRELYKQTYSLIPGDSPFSLINSHLPTSKIFSGEDENDDAFVVNLLGTASSSLCIFDNYVDPECLNKLLAQVPTSTKIQILTQPDKERKLEFDQSLRKKSSGIEIRTSKRSHDRFIIINGSECYHFGHSLKDISRKKTSRFSKIVGAKEVSALNIFFRKSWDESYPI